MNVKADSHQLGFASEKISFQAAVREATVLVGKREKKQTIGTEGNLVHSYKSRSTPVGEAIDYTWHSENNGGFTVAWTLSCLEHLSAITLRASITNETDEHVRLKEITLAKSADDSLCCEGDPAAWLLSPISHEKRVGHLGETLASANDETIEFWKSMNAAVPFKLSTEEHFIDGHWRSYKDFVTLYTR